MLCICGHVDHYHWGQCKTFNCNCTRFQVERFPPLPQLAPMTAPDRATLATTLLAHLAAYQAAQALAATEAQAIRAAWAALQALEHTAPSAGRGEN